MSALKKEKLFFYDVDGYKSKYLEDRLRDIYINGEYTRKILPSTQKDYKRKFKQIGIYEDLIKKDIGKFSLSDWKDAFQMLNEYDSTMFSSTETLNSHLTVFKSYYEWFNGEKIDLHSILKEADIEYHSIINIGEIISRYQLYDILSKCSDNELRGGVPFLLAFEGLSNNEIINLNEKKDIDENNSSIYINRFGNRLPLYIPQESMFWVIKLKNILEVDRGNSQHSKANVNFNSDYLIKDSRNTTNEPVKDFTFNAIVEYFIQGKNIQVKNRLIDARCFGIIDNLIRMDAFFEDFDVYNDIDTYWGIVIKFGKKSVTTKERYKKIFLKYIESLGRERYDNLKQEILSESITKSIVENINQNFIKKEGHSGLKVIRRKVFDDGIIDKKDDDEFWGVDESIFGIEGKERLIIHYKKERRQNFIRKCKQLFKSNYGYFYCQVCECILTDKYGSIAENIIEAHHKTPLYELTEQTKIFAEDIAMVCPTCHSIIHSKYPCYSIQELKNIIHDISPSDKEIIVKGLLMV